MQGKLKMLLAMEATNNELKSNAATE